MENRVYVIDIITPNEGKARLNEEIYVSCEVAFEKAKRTADEFLAHLPKGAEVVDNIDQTEVKVLPPEGVGNPCVKYVAVFKVKEVTLSYEVSETAE